MSFGYALITGNERLPDKGGLGGEYDVTGVRRGDVISKCGDSEMLDQSPYDYGWAVYLPALHRISGLPPHVIGSMKQDMSPDKAKQVADTVDDYISDNDRLSSEHRSKLQTVVDRLRYWAQQGFSISASW